MTVEEIREKNIYFKNLRTEIIEQSNKLNELSNSYKKQYHDFYKIELNGPVEIHDLVEAVLQVLE